MNRDVEFQDVTYVIKQKAILGKSVKPRSVLKGVSGQFGHGKLCAIMGPSGAGKSSLLNSISGLRTAGVDGTIKINKKTSCYLQQEDVHRSYLSLIELMRLSCSLKLKPGLYDDEIVDEILTSLNLINRKNVRAENLSGGERKRLSIALELVANPSIFFLDEPTSGLDEVTAAQCIRLLHKLAKQGRTVIITIHQPSAAIFSLFDQIYVLADGLCVFQGPPQSVVPFLSHISLECPSHYNPSDYIIELCDSDSGGLIPILSDLFQNGKLTCTSSVDSLTGVNTFTMKMPITSMLLETKTSRGSTLLQKMKALSSRLMHRNSDYAVSGFKQFIVLLKLMLLIAIRSKTVLWIQLIHHLMCAIMIGLIFYNTADDGEKMFEHLKYCIGVTFFIVYTQVMVPILSYPSEVKIVKKECFNRWYSLLPYYMALTVSRLPIQVILNVLFLSIVYHMCGLPNQLWRFSLFAMIGIVTSFVAEGLGLCIGATFNVTNGCAVGPMFLAPFLGLAVYGFDFAEQIPVVVNVLMKFSFIRGGVISFVYTLFGFNRKKLNCNEIYCHFDDPRVLLNYLKIENLSLWIEMSILIAIMFIFRALCYFSLRKRFYQ